jgi:putative intracellular protease/amidase
MNILIVMTSHDQLGDTGRKTGLWLEEFAAPYYVFKDAAASITLASPKGGRPPIDPRSDEPDTKIQAILRFRQDRQAQDAFANTAKLSTVTAANFDAVYYPGGHGPLWDLANDADSIHLIEEMYAAGKLVTAVCHGPAAFRKTKAADGRPLVAGKSVTGFSNTEEEEVGLTHVVPFLVENTLKENGGIYSKAENWQPHVVVDGNLSTGQNPASATPHAKAVLDQLTERDSSKAREQRGAAARA